AAQGRRHAGGDGRAGEAHENFQRNPAGLEIGEVAVCIAEKKYGRVDWSRGESFGRGRNPAGGFDVVFEAVGAAGRRFDAARAKRIRGRGYRVRTWRSAANCGNGYRANRGDFGQGVRGGGGDGRNGRNDCARGAARQWKE